jgi:hypothetical protein
LDKQQLAVKIHKDKIAGSIMNCTILKYVGFREVTFLNILQFSSYVPLVKDHFCNTNEEYVIAMEFIEGGFFIPETEKQLHIFVLRLLEVFYDMVFLMSLGCVPHSSTWNCAL